MSYPGIIKEAALGKLFHTDLSLRHIADELGIPHPQPVLGSHEAESGLRQLLPPRWPELQI
jgi:hypothetical protein